MLGGQAWTTPDTSTTRFTVFDNISKAHKLLTALLACSKNANDMTLWNTFAFLAKWDQLSVAEKGAKYSEFACHELNFFVFCKDAEFFQRVVLPFIVNKVDKVRGLFIMIIFIVDYVNKHLLFLVLFLLSSFFFLFFLFF